MLRTHQLNWAAVTCSFALVFSVATTDSAAAGNEPTGISAERVAPSAVSNAGNMPAASSSTGVAEQAAAASPSTRVAEQASTVIVERVTLDQAIERAIRRNPTAQAAALELDRADALVRQARAASLPSLNANLTYTRLDADRVFGNRIVAAKDQFNANAILTVPLIAPSRWAQWSHGKDEARVLVSSSDETRRQLAISVARTFLTVISQHRVVEVNARALETALAHERYSAERLAGGVGRRIDSVRASQQASTTRASVERARVALRRSMEALGVLLGDERPIDVAMEPDLGAVPSLQAAAERTELRLDLQVARTRRQAAERRFRDSWLDFLPQLVGQFQPFYQTPSTLTMPTTGWQAMLMLTVPLYDGGARYGAHDDRRIVRDQAALQATQLLRQARAEVRMAFEAQRSAEAALAATQSAAQQAHEAEQMAILAYEAGASTNLEVIDAERQARDADTEVAIAEDTLRQARLDLLIASGRFPLKR